MTSFYKDDYRERIKQTKQRMQDRGMDVLVISDP